MVSGLALTCRAGSCTPSWLTTLSIHRDGQCRLFDSKRLTPVHDGVGADASELPDQFMQRASSASTKERSQRPSRIAAIVASSAACCLSAFAITSSASDGEKAQRPS
jgi:hypothetical protein